MTDEVFSNEIASGADRIQPLDLISLAIDGVDAEDEERELMRKIYREGGFGGAEFECQNENEARELVQNKLDALRDDNA